MSKINAQKIDRVMVVIGPTRCGKDSLIDTLADQKIAVPGSIKDGQSTTQELKEYEFQVPIINEYWQVFNTPGTDDTKILFTNDQLIQKLQEQLIENAFSSENSSFVIDSIIICEDLFSDTDEIQRSLNHAQQIFGDEKINSSVIVYGNKKWMANKIYNFGQEKSDRIRELCIKFGVKYLEFETENERRQLSSSDREQQMDELITVMRQTEPYDMKTTKQIIAQIKEIASNSWKEAPKIDQMIEVITEDQILVPYQVTEKYIDKEWGEVGRGGRRYWICGPREKIMGWIPVTKEHEVTKYKPETVKRTQNKITQIDPEFEPFLRQAKEEHLQQLRQNLNKKTGFQQIEL